MQKSKTYIAFLRGINVGGNKKVNMADLRTLFESMGFTKVRTYINSGNVIFNSEDLDTLKLNTQIENSLLKKFGFEIKIVIRNSQNILLLDQKIPSSYKNDADQKTDVIFLWDKFDSPDSIKLINTNPKVDTLIYVDGAIIWNVDRKNYYKSGMNSFIATDIYRHMTARNINTLRKLALILKDA